MLEVVAVEVSVFISSAVAVAVVAVVGMDGVNTCGGGTVTTPFSRFFDLLMKGFILIDMGHIVLLYTFS